MGFGIVERFPPRPAVSLVDHVTRARVALRDQVGLEPTHAIRLIGAGISTMLI